ncbi:MAG: thiol-disulfide isomerase-like thioredoxin [Planctomycetota bacterium]|nr:MAG: thiol-disulfide isomerase-like thioredoxin [Planctomycetota bacterium]
MKRSFALLVILLAAIPVCGADDAVLHLTNGGFVPGELKGSEQPSVMRWQSSQFTRPFEFSMAGVSAVQYAVPSKLPKPTGEYCFELAAGDVLFGELLGLTDDVAEVEVARFGRLHVKRDQIRRLYRWSSGADLIYLGPNGLTEWKESSAAKHWRDEGGQPLTEQEGASIRGDFRVPAQAIIEFELTWKSKPDFVFALGVSDSDDETIFKRAFRFEVWDNELVVRCELGREADVDSVQQAASGAGRAHYLAYLDQEKGKLLVYTPSGTPCGQINVTPRKPQVHSGLRLTNKRGDVRLERLRISRWNGIPPREVQANKSRLHRADGAILYGQLAAFDAGSKQFTVRDGNEETKVAADQIASVFLSPPDNDVPRPFRAFYFDGTRISGELASIADDHLRLTSPAIQEPLRLPLSELRSLSVLKHENSDSVTTVEGRAGRLELGGLKLHGRLTAGRELPDASCLVWHPDFSATASPLRLGATGRIVYRDPPPKPKVAAQPQQVQPQPVGFADAFLKALAGGPNGAVPQGTNGKRTMHLRSGDTIPCEVTKITEEGINFKTSLSDATFVPHDKVKAVELTVVDGPPKLNKTKRERLLTLPRLQRDSPPTQLIRSKNGDFLRGRVIDMDDQELRLEVRIETKKIPRDRISQIIWFHPDELTEATGETQGNVSGERGGVSPPVSSSGDNANANNRGADAAPLAEDKTAATRVQALRSDGIRLTFVPDQFVDKTLSGKSDVLGSCRAEVDQVDQFLIGAEIEKSAADLAYHRWRLHHAVQPKIAMDIDGNDSGERKPGIESVLVGKPAPDFNLELLASGGKKFHLADQKGKVVILDFWATWCGPCLQTMPLVEKVAHEFEAEGVQLIAVNLEEPAKQITATLERHKLQVTVAMDIDGVAATKYQATAIPQTVIIDREGKVARLFVGGGPKLADQLREALREVLAGPSAKSE